MRRDGFVGLAGLAVLAAMSGAARDIKPRPRRYSQFCGPPHPKSRQQRRALERAASAAIRKATQSKDTPQ